MLRRIKRFLGFSARGTYFPNNDSVAPSADGSLISTSSRKSTKSEMKSAKKEKKKSPLVEEHHEPAAFVHVSTPPAEIIIGGEESVACSASETDRQTIITDSLPYRDPSDKVFLESPPLPSQNPPSSSSTRSLAGSGASMESRMAAVCVDDVAAPIPRDIESVYSTDLTQDTDSQKTSDAKSRELAVDCGIQEQEPSKLNSSQSSTASLTSEGSSLCVNLPTITLQHEQQDELAGAPQDAAAMKKFNAELDSILKTSAPPFQVSTARLPPMLAKELPPPEEQNSLLIEEEFDDSKDNSVARILNESHEATTRSPENKHLRSYGY